MITTIINLLGSRNILLTLFCGLCFVCGYYYSSLRSSLIMAEYKLEAVEQKSKLIEQYKESDKLSRDKIAEIERDNLANVDKLKHDYENTISSLRTKYKLANSVQCSPRGANDMSRKAGDTDKLRCYTEDELYRKIEASMVITNECDKLANNYNALLKVCKVD